MSILKIINNKVHVWKSYRWVEYPMTVKRINQMRDDQRRCFNRECVDCRDCLICPKSSGSRQKKVKLLNGKMLEVSDFNTEQWVEIFVDQLHKKFPDRDRKKIRKVCTKFNSLSESQLVHNMDHIEDKLRQEPRLLK